MTQPRAEYPRPQFVRAEWVNLNGEWQFEIDRSDSGLERGVRDRELRTADRRAVRAGERAVRDRGRRLHGGGLVPDDGDDSRGVGRQGRRAALPGRRPRRDRLGQRHRGCPASRWFHAVQRQSAQASPSRARRRRSSSARGTRHKGPQARGKQSQLYFNHACLYTRTTGIWQTVWLEAVPTVHLEAAADHPGRGRRMLPPRGAGLGQQAGLQDPRHPQGRRRRDRPRPRSAPTSTSRRASTLQVPADRVRLWDTTDPHLYDVTPRADRCRRQRRRHGRQLRRPAVGVDQRPGDPDQRQARLPAAGARPGLLAGEPDDRAVRGGAGRATSSSSLAAGFNGARLHQKVFEERFLYHADRLGYLVWGEFGDWGSGVGHTGDDNQQPTASYVDAMARGGRARLQPPEHHRLVPAERDAPAPARPDHPARRRDAGDVPGHQGR